MNKLINEKSPYLLQHAYNPVDWYAWNDEAFEKAKNKNKPIFLSIGYSTCHWCHVMEKESFEDERIAALLNETFICIKVDREERPDIDDVYMTVCQAMTGSGGWPLTIMMTPDKQPFFAATYIPPKNIYGRTGMLDLIANVQKIWQEKQGEVLQQAKEITDQLATALHKPATEMDLPYSILAAASAQLIGSYDKEFGGFGTAPKFPTPHHLLFLLRHAHFSKDEQALASVTHTLRAMRFGGIFDQIGKGFHRYSTDREWRVPHFEKMLYDQAFLSITYIEALQITQDTFFSKTAQEILDYVLRDLQSPDGGFYSAEDADSEGHEGTFYTWRYTEIIKLLGKETTDTLAQHYDLQAAGNFNEEATGQPTGQNIFIFQSNSEKHPGDLFAAECSQLFAEREKRVRPHLDDKILTDWNGMMIAALARAAHVFGEKKYSEAAEKAASFILTQMMQKDRLLHRYRDGEAAIEAFSADYAFMIYGLLELYTATFKTYYLEKAIALQKQQIKYFWDDKNNGFFTSAHDQEQLLFQQKDQYDNATPSTNSMSAANLIRLARLTAFSGFDHTAEKLIRSLAAHVKRAPTAFSYFLYAFYLTQQSKEVIIVGKQDAGDSKKMLDAIRAKYLPHASILFKTEKNHLEKLAPFTKEYDMQDERATAFVCTNYSCQTPTHDIQKMLADLK